MHALTGAISVHGYASIGSIKVHYTYASNDQIKGTHIEHPTQVNRPKSASYRKLLWTNRIKTVTSTH